MVALNGPLLLCTWGQICKSNALKYDWDKHKSRFYTSFNAIYSKLGRLNNEMVTMHLVSSIALPSLLFATEAVPQNKSFIKCIEHPWSRAFMKVFNTYDHNIVNECQYNLGLPSVEQLVRRRKIKFINSMAASQHWFLRLLHALYATKELNSAVLN